MNDSDCGFEHTFLIYGCRLQPSLEPCRSVKICGRLGRAVSGRAASISARGMVVLSFTVQYEYTTPLRGSTQQRTMALIRAGRGADW
eukprot:5212512-Prymnesium_polylepis.2